MHRLRKTAATAWELARPFTLLAPAFGMACGATMAIGATWRADTTAVVHPWMWRNAALGALMAALLNAASNMLNQVCDLEIDRINKPARPLVTGRLRVRHALWLSAILYTTALLLAAAISPPGTHGMCLILAAAAALATIAYSAPPLRLKRFGIVANLTIALPRGLLLTVAGWSVIRPVNAPDPWAVGLVFLLFLLGAATTKDYADIAGDRHGGCRTLPIRFGTERSARLIAPAFFLPFLLILPLTWTGMLTGNALMLNALGIGLAAWGLAVAHMIRRAPEALASGGVHPSWLHMYLLMLTAQTGFALAHWL